MRECILWTEWFQAFSALRSAFNRQATFVWCMIASAGFCIRGDLNGVTGIVRAFSLKDEAYHCLLRALHSKAIDRQTLVKCWVALIFRLFKPVVLNNRVLLICDGINIAKEGKRMPGVKLLKQDSMSNSKAEYIMGHYLQSISIAVQGPNERIYAVPASAEIHDGITRTHRGAKTRIEKMSEMSNSIAEITNLNAVVVADSYYASKSMISSLRNKKNHLVSRVKNNAVAYLPPEPEPPRRGRPRKYGKKIILREILAEVAESSCQHHEYRFKHRDLVWRPIGRKVRFVFTYHAKKGTCILLCTDLKMAPEEIIEVYRTRWKIETGFKTSKHVFGVFNYHFWSKDMKPTKRASGGIGLVGHGTKFREKIERKVAAFHNHIQLGYIAHGLTMHLALNHERQVWGSFRGWLRTINKDLPPSEQVVRSALAEGFSEYFARSKKLHGWLKILALYANKRRPRQSMKVA